MLPNLSVLDISMGKREREAAQAPPDNGQGPLLFYTANKDGGSSAGPLLNDGDRNGPRRILSNFAETPLTVVHDGTTGQYRTVENAFQALKYQYAAITQPTTVLKAAFKTYASVIARGKTAARTFKLSSMILKKDGTPNMSTADPSFQDSVDKREMQTAFHAGVRSPTLEEVTVADRMEIMNMVLAAKFEQNANARAYLLSTGTRILIEHTTRDSYWGDGGSGEDSLDNNQLGKALMRVRKSLK
jgi:hypothetical protein